MDYELNQTVLEEDNVPTQTLRCKLINLLTDSIVKEVEANLTDDGYQYSQDSNGVLYCTGNIVFELMGSIEHNIIKKLEIVLDIKNIHPAITTPVMEYQYNSLHASTILFNVEMLERKIREFFKKTISIKWEQTENSTIQSFYYCESNFFQGKGKISVNDKIEQLETEISKYDAILKQRETKKEAMQLKQNFKTEQSQKYTCTLPYYEQTYAVKLEPQIKQMPQQQIQINRPTSEEKKVPLFR